MNVLILHQHFNTPEKGGPLRSYYLAKALLESGVHPVVITAHQEKSKRIEDVEGIEVHYLPVAYDNRFGFYQRGWSFLKFVSAAIHEAGKISSIDLCYAISAPMTVGIAARILKMRHGIPYVFEVGDLWPDAPIQLGYLKNSLLKWSLYRLENMIYSNAKSIVAVSSVIKERIKKKIDKRIHVIPNMADTEFFQPAEKDGRLIEKFGINGKFVVSYIGAIGAANGLEYLVDCARVSQQTNLPLHFMFCGNGALKSTIESSVKSLQLKNVSILAFQNREGVRDVLNVTDAIFVCFKPFPILETGAPNKYFDGLAAGKLMMINFGGWIKEEIDTTQCGIALDPKNPADLLNKIKPFLSDKNVLTKYQSSSRELAETKYSRKIIGPKFSAIIRGEIDNLQGRATH